MSHWPFTKGLHDIGNGCYGYLQPDGGWGYSNAGFIEDSGQSLLVDTLIDLPLTREMLDTLGAKIPAAQRIDRVLNTHVHPDHTGGNSLLPGAEIIASSTTVEEMQALQAGPMKDIITNWQNHGEAGQFMYDVMISRFDLANATHVPPTRTFEKELTLWVGTKEVRLLKVGPAHTKGDVLAYLPREKIVFTGDVLFHKVHPVLGSGGPVQSWIEACETILGWDVEVVVPGHGPITDKSGVRLLRDYLVYLRTEAKKRFDAGLNYLDAALDISLDAFRDWPDEERIIGSVNALYREFGGVAAPPPVTFAQMRRYRLGQLKAKADCGCGGTHHSH